MITKNDFNTNITASNVIKHEMPNKILQLTSARLTSSYLTSFLRDNIEIKNTCSNVVCTLFKCQQETAFVNICRLGHNIN